MAFGGVGTHGRDAIPIMTIATREAQALRCTDPDDQKFVDLALALAPACLISRDRAVLKLARRAALRAVLIRPPAHYPDWHRQLGARSG